MTGYVHHLDIVIQENHLMQSHAVVVSVLQPPYRFPLHANRPQHLRPILIQDHAPDQPSRAVFPPRLRLPGFVVHRFYSPSPGSGRVCLAFSILPILILFLHHPGQL